MKVLRRKVAIREKDFHVHLKPSAFRYGYDRVEFIPMTAKTLAAEATWLMLKSGTGAELDSIFFSTRENGCNEILKACMSNSEEVSRRYIDYLRFSKHLWDPKYYKWEWDWNPDCVRIRYRRNTEWSNMGMVVLERDIR